MNAIRRAGLSLVVLMSVLAADAVAQDAASKPKSLYHRLGGYDMIAMIVDDFGPKLGKDPKIAPLVAGLSAEHRMRNRQLIVDQICQLTGGPCIYFGRSLLSSLQGLGITEEHFKQAGALMLETLDKFKIGEPERSELMGVIGKLAPDIVEKPKPAPTGQQ
jgi:hemoglobin